MQQAQPSLSSGGHWVVKHDGDTDTLTGVEKVVIGSAPTAGRSAWRQRRRLPAPAGCDRRGAVNRGATILIALGLTPKVRFRRGIRHRGGLYIDKPDLTLQGVDAHGVAITRRPPHRPTGATIISGNQTGLRPNHSSCCGHRYCHPRAALAGRAIPTTSSWKSGATTLRSRTTLSTSHRGGHLLLSPRDLLQRHGTRPPTTSPATTSTTTSSTRDIVANGVGDPADASAPTSSSPANEFVGHSISVPAKALRHGGGQRPGLGYRLAAGVDADADHDRQHVREQRRVHQSVAATRRVPLAQRSAIADIVATHGDVTPPTPTSWTPLTATSSPRPATTEWVPLPELRGHQFDRHAEPLARSDADNVFGGQRDYLHDGIRSSSRAARPGRSTRKSWSTTSRSRRRPIRPISTLTLATPVRRRIGDPQSAGRAQLTLSRLCDRAWRNVDVTGNDLDNTITGNSGNNTLDAAPGTTRCGWRRE